VRSLLFVCGFVCEQDNSRTCLRMSTKNGRHGKGVTLWKWLNFDVNPDAVWIYDHFSTSINITQVGLCPIYCHWTEGVTALLSDNAAALAEFALSEHILFIIY